MADYKKTSISEIRDYLWNEIKDAGILNRDDYLADGFIIPLNPIIPAQEIPEFNNLIPGKTYIVYDYEINSYEPDFWMCDENLILSIVCPDYNKSVEILNFLLDLFRRMDLTAKDMNLQLSSSSPFKFHYFYINNMQSPAPFEQEGGNQVSLIDISYKYSRLIGSDGRFL